MLTQLVASYRFWEVAVLWAKETQEPEDIVARALARAIVCDGLRVNSVDPAKINPGEVELRGYPYIGYRAHPQFALCLLSAHVLEHLLAVVRTAEAPSREILTEVFIKREDFLAWLQWAHTDPPVFWFGHAHAA